MLLVALLGLPGCMALAHGTTPEADRAGAGAAASSPSVVSSTRRPQELAGTHADAGGAPTGLPAVRVIEIQREPRLASATADGPSGGAAGSSAAASTARRPSARAPGRSEGHGGDGHGGDGHGRAGHGRAGHVGDGHGRAPDAAPTRLPGGFTSSADDPIHRHGHVAGDAVLGDDGDGFRRIDRLVLPVSPAMPGVVLPYPVDNVFSTFSDCRPGGRTHRGLDLGGVGPNGGLGTPIYAMARSRVTLIGRPEDDPDLFGHPEHHAETVTRGRHNVALPAREVRPGYGPVHYFTRTYGSWRSGTIIVMEALDGPLAGHRIRYMHLGAVHPELRVGDVVEAGQEVALMGGTAVQRDMPHVHIDIETAGGRRVDVAPYLGLPADPGRCR